VARSAKGIIRGAQLARPSSERLPTAHQVILAVAAQAGLTVRVSIKWISLAFIAWQLSPAALVLANQVDTFDVVVRVLFAETTGLTITLFGVLAAGGVTWGFIERGVRRKTVARLHPRNKKLERERDPDRSSSRLSEGGDTNPDDV
jgi:hypothetical protein